MVEYNLLKRQIDDICMQNAQGKCAESVNTLSHEVSYKKGVYSVNLGMKEFSDADTVGLFNILKQYYLAPFEVDDRGGFGFLIKAKSQVPLFSKEEAETIRLTIDPSYSISSDVKKMIKVEKETEFRQEDINLVADILHRYEKKEEQKCSPKERLLDYGAFVYEADPEMGWDSIAGYKTIKDEVKQSVILPFERPEVFEEIGLLTRTNYSSNVPRAVLFSGPPGTGKTTMAKVIASESEIPLVYVPVESIMSHYYGVAEKKLAGVFDTSAELGKAVLFLDEIDSLAGSRDKDMHEATRRILSVMLRKMQGIMSVKNVLLIGATNRPEDLDHALTSRFNRTIYFPLPNSHERGSIIHYYAKHLIQDDIRRFSEETERCSGRDIEDMCSDAERMWAQKLISDEAIVCAPPVGAYLEAAKRKERLTK